MEFNLTAFTLAPTIEVYNKCRKQDLLVIADFFSITVPREAAKRVIKDKLYMELVTAGILPSDSEDMEKNTETADVGSFAGLPPSIDPTSPRFDPVLALKFKELDLELKKQEQELQVVNLRTLEVQANRDIKLRSLDIEAETLRQKPVPAPRARLPSSPASVRTTFSSGPQESHSTFDVTKHIKLVPPFKETEVDSYFIAFERIAGKLGWPKDMWGLLLQCNLAGRAQQVCSALSVEQCLDYEVVKRAVLRAYELVPEAYRQRYRRLTKTVNQTYTEFAREKKNLFEKWCGAGKISSLEQLQELILLEDFKNCVPESVVVHLNDQKVMTLSEAAVIADEFVLTHKNVFPVNRMFHNQPPVTESGVRDRFLGSKLERGHKTVSNRVGDKRVCFYCLDPGHKIVDCKAWKQKMGTKTKSVAFIHSAAAVENSMPSHISGYEPFMLRGTVSLSPDSPAYPVSILRDTGACQSLILDSVLPFSSESYTGTSILVRGVELGCVKVPLHGVCLSSELASGPVKIGVRSELPVNGVDLILGNDLAGSKVFSSPIMIEKPDLFSRVNLSTSFSTVFPDCAVTRAQARKFSDVIDLSDSFIAPSFEPAECKLEIETKLDVPSDEETPPAELPFLKTGREQLISMQRSDPTLKHCIEAANANIKLPAGVEYYWDNEVLMRRWNPRLADDALASCQIVLPFAYHSQVLKLSHEHVLAGHLGIAKTYYRLTKYFYWPGVKSSVSRFCKACHTCQLSGKPNQKVPPAPLHPIPAMGEPFERLVIDCVGPLPRSKSGHQYILTIMCAATRFPEAIPLHTLKAKTVVKELVKFLSTFGLPRVIQTDQGTNFTSKLFAQVAKELGVSHVLSSAYHPQSQGAVERFHQTLKSMLRAYCLESGKEWVEGLPLLMFAVREAKQESTGFSPAELVFGHTVRGPLKLLQEQLLSANQSPVSVLDYVSRFREKLHQARDVAQSHLLTAQAKMKTHFDRKSLSRSFQPGDSVLVLLPIQNSPLQARFAGPYSIKEKLSETDYVVNTPDRKRKTRVCHINMLKAYVTLAKSNTFHDSSVTPVIAAACSPVYSPAQDGLGMGFENVSCERLENSTIINGLETYLAHLSTCQREDIVCLISRFPMLFSDVPSQTTVICHDIDVGNSPPVKQHPYRVNHQKREIMREEVRYLLQHGFVQPSQSPWSSPCLLVPKPDTTYRFCTDYRKVNSLTKPDSFPLPRMEDCVDRIGAARYITKLDLLKGYWQVPLTDRASEISAFVTPDNFLQYSVMAFGMRNAPATFQRLMHRVLSGVANCEAYLDDVVIFSDTWENHLETLTEVFSRLAEASLTLNLAKCDFAKAIVTYLGKKVGHGQVCPVEAKVLAILDFPVPINKRELRRFLGMVGYYRGFCENFATVVSPLTNLLSPFKKFLWSAECANAFAAAKDIMCNAPVLAAPDFTLPFQLQIDASATGVGAVLLQEDPFGVDHPVCYFSRKLSKCQQNYSTIEKETLALLMALQHFEVYVGGSCTPVLVYTDHNPLTFLSRMCNSNQRLMRWSLIVQEYNLDIRHKKGSENVIADALSRTK